VKKLLIDFTNRKGCVLPGLLNFTRTLRFISVYQFYTDNF